MNPLALGKNITRHTAMRLKLQKLWQLRPRLLTVALVAIVGVMMVLANLTDELEPRGAEVLAGSGQLRFSLQDPEPIDRRGAILRLFSVSYGWPLLWRQYIFGSTMISDEVLGESYSPGRLAANLAAWLFLLAALGAACEWLLRWRPPRFRWSLRTMLIAISLMAMLCGWFAAARDRAGWQDMLIAAEESEVWAKRWGPKWFELIGADRYHRKLIGARLDLEDYVTSESEEIERQDRDRKRELLAQLSRLGGLQYLLIKDSELGPQLVEVVRAMPELRALSVDITGIPWEQRSSRDCQRLSHDCLAAIGAMHDLKHLSLAGIPIAGEHLAGLAKLTNLQSLWLRFVDDPGIDAPNVPLLSRLPALPRLEAVGLRDSYVGDGGLRYLSVLPRLKKLNLNWLSMTNQNLPQSPQLKFDAGLTGLDRLTFLEEVAVSGDMASPTGLESLLALKHLKTLHVDEPRIGAQQAAILELDEDDRVRVLEVDLDRCRRALDALRKSNPGILIVNDVDAEEAIIWPGEPYVETEFEIGFDEKSLARGRSWLDASMKRPRLPTKYWPKPVNKQ